MLYILEFSFVNYPYSSTSILSLIHLQKNNANLCFTKVVVKLPNMFNIAVTALSKKKFKYIKLY